MLFFYLYIVYHNLVTECIYDNYYHYYSVHISININFMDYQHSLITLESLHTEGLL